MIGSTLENRWVSVVHYIGLGAIIVAFVAFKLPYLDLPLYWDEAWVYGPAVRAMHEHGVSLLPDTIGVELSRGHPLMLHFLASCWTHLFGTSLSSLHAFAMIVSIALLLTTFWVGTRIGSMQVALAATACVALTETFLAQSGILLPEVLLSLFVVLAAGGYIIRSTWVYILAGSAALLTKESALVLIATLVIWHVMTLFVPSVISPRSTERWWLLILLAPFLPAFLFFLYQRLQYGWFLFPDHLGMMTWDLKQIIYKIKLAYADIFETQGMPWLVYGFAMAGPLLWRGFPWKRALLIIALFIIAIKVLFGRWPLPQWPTLVVVVLCFGWIFLLLFHPGRKSDEDPPPFTAIAFLFVPGFIAFSALNFFTDRYLLCLVPFVALGALSFLHSAFITRHRYLFPAFALVLAGLMLAGIGNDKRIGDTRLSYADDIHVHLEMIHFLESRNAFELPIQAGYMDAVYMTDPAAGYLSTDKRFIRPRAERTTETQYVLCSSSTPGSDYEDVQRSDLVLVERFEQGIAWTEIYQPQVRP